MYYLIKFVSIIIITFLFIRCTDVIDEQSNNIEKEKYIKLAKKFEKKYLPEYKKLMNKKYDSTTISQAKQIAQRNGFNEQKAKKHKEQILKIAEKYGINRETIHLKPYFYVDPLNKKIYNRDFYNMLFAFVKYKSEQMKPKLKKKEQQVNDLTSKYDSLINREDNSEKKQQLIREYQRKKSSIIVH